MPRDPVDNDSADGSPGLREEGASGVTMVILPIGDLNIVETPRPVIETHTARQLFEEKSIAQRGGLPSLSDVACQYAATGEITNDPVLDSSTWSFVICRLSDKGGVGHAQ